MLKMADTSEQQTLSEPHTNGVMDGLTEEEKSKMRPADIDAVTYLKENTRNSVEFDFQIHFTIFSS